MTDSLASVVAGGSLRVALGLCLALIPGLSAPAGLPPASLPAGIQVQHVFTDARLGDQTMNGVQVLGEFSSQELLDRFRRHWEAQGSRSVWRDDIAGWTILSRALHFPFIEVLQVRPARGGRALAYLSQVDVSGRADRSPTASHEPWLPGSFSLLQSFFSKDHSRLNTTLVAVTALPPEQASKSMAQHLARQGFRASASPAGDGPAPGAPFALFLKQGHEIAMTMIEQSGRTVMVLNVSMTGAGSRAMPENRPRGRGP